jgi:hypothetical protein
MGWPRMPRPICAQCKSAPVRNARGKFCGDACFRASRRGTRPVCPVCRTNLVQQPWTNKTCSKSCANMLRSEQLTRLLAERLPEALAAGHAAFLARMTDYLREQFAPFQDRVPLKELMAIGARIYRKGKYDGRSAAYYTYVVQPRTRAAKAPMRERRRQSA